MNFAIKCYANIVASSAGEAGGGGGGERGAVSCEPIRSAIF